MWELLKEVVAVCISFVLIFLVGIGVVPEQAVAPSLPPPTATEEVATTTVAVAPPEEGATTTPAAPPPAPAPKPLVDTYEQSLKEALETLARIERERATLATSVDLNAVARGATVNILCLTAGSAAFGPISASGVVVDERGVILTNAHVGQYFLLKDYPTPNFVDCTVRTGSPAQPTYKAKLLFLPPRWIMNNADKIDDEAPRGNGEHDYALLLISSTTSGGPVPTPLPYLPLVSTAPQSGSPALLAGYPAGFLGGATILKELYATSANATVGTVYTYDATTADLFSIGGTVVAQQGASGGAVAVVNAASASKVALAGLIVTSSEAAETANRDLRALSTEYIIRDFATERGIALGDYLTRDLAAEQQVFMQSTAPSLTAALVDVLEH